MIGSQLILKNTLGQQNESLDHPSDRGVLFERSFSLRLPVGFTGEALASDAR